MKRRLTATGFTIVELLIAIVVFSVMLLIVSTTVLAISRQFYKGMIKARTQSVARQIIEELSTNIQFSSSRPTYLGINEEVEGWCIADRRYLFVKHKQLGTNTPNQSPGVLMRGGACTDPLPSSLAPADGLVELMGENMRLADLVLEPDNTQDVWRIRVNVVFGADDQVCNPDMAGDCESNAVTSAENLRSPNLVCKFQAGSQFCASAPFEAVVVRRLQ